MKNALLTVIALSFLSTACAPGSFPMRTFPERYGRYPGPAYDPARYVPAPSPAGRWDNVMMLAAGTPVQVLLMSGALASGQIASASSSTLRIMTASGVVDVAARDVMRVDRAEAGKMNSALRDGAKGAAVGAGAIGVLGLITGRMPPPRLFAAGAILGGYNQIGLAAVPDGSAVTIYVAAASGPAGPPTSPIRRETPE
jgi:hypothetical protein